MDMRSNHQAKLHGILSSILAEHASTRVNGRVSSERTMTAYGEVLGMSFDKLHDMGFHIQNPRNLGEDHIKALCEQWYKEGKRVSTMQEYLSKIRVFKEVWLCQTGSVKSLPYYLPDVDPDLLIVRKVAVKSKSWTENGIDVAEKIRDADELDERFGLMLRLELAFGLRRKEVVSTRPWKADRNDKLVIYPGEAKGGRPRDIYIDNEKQREVLDYVKSKIGKNEHLGWLTDTRGKQATFKYNLGRYNRYMVKIGITRENAGVTGHGLRAQYAENASIIAGMLPFTLGGTSGQMDKESMDVTRRQISELLGHSRLDVTVSYCGSGGRHTAPDPADLKKTTIQAALLYCHSGVTTAVPEERKADCLVILVEMTSIGVEITMGQIQLLWEIYSQRFGSRWLKPEQGIQEAMQQASNRLIKHMEKNSAK